ncbi:Uncharacterized protein dnm_092510 [Desulfonema magnum]|uniref:Uncharacterized protein n=1 Tax=Desulfonema magnum TaxID=45655 RepID=A0A975BWQ1_9BACT|nr:Uncharacterized protein dnm_092510 [Desulfonema magnum]
MCDLKCHEGTKARSLTKSLCVFLCLRVFVALSFRLKKIAHGLTFENITIFRNGGSLP